MELGVGAEESLGALAVADLVAGPRELLETALCLGVELARGEPGGCRLEEQAELEQLVHVLERDRGDDVAVASDPVDELLLVEALDGGAGGGSADAEARAELLLGDRLPRSSPELSVKAVWVTPRWQQVKPPSVPSFAVSVIRGMLDKVERVHHMSHLLCDRSAEAIHEHQELLDALIAGDADRAEQVMIQQILAAKQFVIEAMLASSSLQTVNIVLNSQRSEPGE